MLRMMLWCGATVSIAAAVVVVIAWGCTGERSDQEHAPKAERQRRPRRTDTGGLGKPTLSADVHQHSPGATLRTLWCAADQGNVEIVVQCCVPDGDKWRELQMAWCSLVYSQRELYRAVVKAYGPEGWRRFQDAVVRRKGGAGLVPTSYVDEVGKKSWDDTIKVLPGGNEAICFFVGTRVPHLYLTLRQGKWYWNMGKLLGNPAFDTRRYRGLAKAAIELTQVVEGGASIEEIAIKAAECFR